MWDTSPPRRPVISPLVQSYCDLRRAKYCEFLCSATWLSELYNIFDLVELFTSEVFGVLTSDIFSWSRRFIWLSSGQRGSFIFTLYSGQCPLRREATIEIWSKWMGSSFGGLRKSVLVVWPFFAFNYDCRFPKWENLTLPLKWTISSLRDKECW